MKQKLTTEEKAHSRNSKLIEDLLNTVFTNEYYDISFEKQSPNVVRGLFKKKDSEDVYESNFGLPVEAKGATVKAEIHADIEPIVIWGFKSGETIPYHPEFEINADSFVNFLNNELISVQDNRGIDNLNNPSPTGVDQIDDLNAE